MKQKKANLLKNAVQAVGLPGESVGTQAKILLCGREELRACPCLALQKYTESEICVKLCNGRLRVQGKDLRVAGFCGGNLVLRGNILALDLSETESERMTFFKKEEEV